MGPCLGSWVVLVLVLRLVLMLMMDSLAGGFTCWLTASASLDRSVEAWEYVCVYGHAYIG